MPPQEDENNSADEGGVDEQEEKEHYGAEPPSSEEEGAVHASEKGDDDNDNNNDEHEPSSPQTNTTMPNPPTSTFVTAPAPSKPEAIPHQGYLEATQAREWQLEEEREKAAAEGWQIPKMTYRCDCNELNEFVRGAKMRCKGCGRQGWFYKVRTKRIVQFEAR